MQIVKAILGGQRTTGSDATTSRKRNYYRQIRVGGGESGVRIAHRNSHDGQEIQILRSDFIIMACHVLTGEVLFYGVTAALL